MVSVENRVKEIIENLLKKNPEMVRPNAHLKDDLGADSLDMTELVMSLEDHFDIDIPDVDAEKFKTVKDVIQYVETVV